MTVRLFLFAVIIPFSLHAQERPNILFIMSDDHDNDAISAYNKQLIQTPNIDRLANEGMIFKNAFVGNSICSPSRATLLTGQHSHKNGVRDNRTPFDTAKQHIGHLLRDNGYQTAVIGKWHLHSYPTGFDYWKILPGQGLYVDPRVITMQKDTITIKGYSTDVITDEAIAWLKQRDRSKPFALFFNHKAPHRYFFPKLNHLISFSNRKFPEPPTLFTDTTGRGSAWRIQTMSILRDMKLSSDLKVHPDYLKGIADLEADSAETAYYHAIMRRVHASERKIYDSIYAVRGKIIQNEKPTGEKLLAYKYQWYMQDYLACVASIDESIGRILNLLDEEKISNNTMIAYTSDQGFYLGENGWFDKRFAYDVSMQTPLLIRWPARIKPSTTSTAMVQNIDFAPTLLDITNTKVPGWMQGISLEKILSGTVKQTNREYLYYHYYEFVRDHTVIPHIAIRSRKDKLIYFYTVREWQYFDLEKDPLEQHNLVSDPLFKTQIEKLKKEMLRLSKFYEDHEATALLQ